MSNRAPKIVVVGSANVDYIVRSEHLPRPGETVVGGELITAGGGKGANQAIAARRLGAEVVFVARVGSDAPGAASLAAYRSEGLDTTAVQIDETVPTGVALILVDREGQNMISVASGANLHLSPDDVSAARAAGDAFTAGLAVSLARGESPKQALAYATAAGALTTTRGGAQPALPPRREVEALLRRLTDD